MTEVQPSTKRSQPFCGQIGEMLMLDGTLSANEVYQIHELGPNMYPTPNSDKYALPNIG